MLKIAPFYGLLLSALPLLCHSQENAAQALPRTASPEGALTYFLSPANGATVTSPFSVLFGLRGMGVAPAGVTNPNTGHRHLLIDVATLPPAPHTLQLVLGDALHIPHEPPVRSEKITITVTQ